MNYYRYDESGNKILCTYSEKNLGKPEIKPPIKIESYEDFFSCVKNAEEQKQYRYADRDTRYSEAMGYLSTHDREKYQEYYQRMRKEYLASR